MTYLNSLFFKGKSHIDDREQEMSNNNVNYKDM